MLFSDSPRPQALDAIRFINTTPLWLDDPRRPASRPRPDVDLSVDLLVIGAGFTGLWTAVLAKLAEPARSVAVVDGDRLAEGASGRNGGFVSHSLTHGVRNGRQRWPEEFDRLSRLGHENLDALIADVAAFGIDCDLRQVGEVTVALEAYQLDELAETAAMARAAGDRVDILERGEVQSLVHSTTYLGGMIDHDIALVNPARFVWGLADVAERLGVRIFERSRIDELHDVGQRVVALMQGAAITARRVAVATNAYPSVIPQMQRYIVPVYDYAITTEPLTAEQWSSLGWHAGNGVGDAGNQFHYYRPTPDGRILWGGYDAIYHRDRGFDHAHEIDRAAFGRLAEHFLQTFPQLEGVRFTHGWGGAIDTCSRFSPFWGTVHGGKTAYAAGYTGLGVGSSRFGARVMLDLLAGADTELTRLAMVRTKPMAFPPEPFRSIGINWTTRSLQAADRHEGRRNLWLRTLDRVGLGFAS